jgi:hypothetical protein
MDDLSSQFAALELKLAESEAARLAAEARTREQAEKTFTVKMMAISSSASGDTSKADTARRGAPVPTTSTADFMEPYPVVDPARVTDAWAAFSKKLGEWTPPDPPVREVSHVQPVVRMVLEAALGESPRQLRYFKERVASDDIAVAEAKPDFLVTHAREARASLLGSALILEVKLPGKQGKAEQQARAYARRRVYKAFTEARNRNEAGSDVAAVAAGTDGRHIVFARVSSGAPADGESWATARPCPTVVSESFALLPPEWTGSERITLKAAPSEGFAALVRVLSAEGLLAGDLGPLKSLRVQWAAPAGGGAGGGGGGGDAAPPVIEEVALGERIGQGGASDVYAVDGHATHVIKVGRCASANMDGAYSAEATALAMLAEAALTKVVPALVRVGSRARRAGDDAPEIALSLWQVLELSPRGVPLEDWLRVFVDSGAASDADAAGVGAASRESRRKVADAVATRVHAALTHAHGKDIIHCDVRPSNVVMADDKAVLVDWDVSRRAGESLCCVGVAAYADERVFSEAGCRAQPAVDMRALAFLWLSIAMGCAGRAPWLQQPGSCSWDEFSVLEARSAWLEGDVAAEEAKACARAAAVIHAARAPRDTAGDRAVVEACRERWGIAG